MKKTILITGGSGMLAEYFSDKYIADYNFRFLTRKVKRQNDFLWDINRQYIDPKAFEGVDVVLHLAGSPLTDKRWTENRKQLILSSRVDSTDLLLSEVKRQNITLEAFISASAVGFYGSSTTENIYTETDEKGNDFLSDICVQWEKSAKEFEITSHAKRVAIARIGIILAPDAGALNEIKKPFKFRLGSSIGDGEQYVPWIHISDMCRILNFMVTNPSINGVYNSVAPQHTNYQNFSTLIGRTMKRPIWLPNIPSFILRIVLGEMSTIIVNGSRVSAGKLVDNGFKFEFKDLNGALKNLLAKH